MTRPRFTPLELSISYDQGKTLTFYEIPNTLYGQPSYALEQTVQLRADLGFGLQTYFTGKVKSSQYHGENCNEGITYIAHGMHQLADEIQVEGPGGGPLVINGTTLFGSQTLPTRVYDAVASLFSNNAAKLATAGIPSNVDWNFNGTAYLKEDVTLSGGFFSALREILAYEPGAKPFFDDVSQRWKVVNVFQSPVTILDVSSINLQSHDINVSTDGRYSAIKLLLDGDANDTGIFTPIAAQSFSMIPLWDSLYESDWTRERGSYPFQMDGITLNPYYDVYRTFGIAGPVPTPKEGSVQVWYQPYEVAVSVTDNKPYLDDPDFGRPRLVTIINSDYGAINYVASPEDPFPSLPRFTLNHFKVYYAPELLQTPGGSFYTGGMPALASIDPGEVIPITNRAVDENGIPIQTSDDPLIANAVIIKLAEPLAWGNLDMPGSYLVPDFTDAPPSGVFATWFYPTPLQGQSVVSARNAIRLPNSGYSGEVYTRFGVQREKIVLVSPQNFNSTYASKLLQVYGTALVTADLPIEGDPIVDFLGLNRSVILKHSAQTTPVQSIAVPILSYSYKFGKRGISSVQLSSDLSQWIKE